MSLTRDQLGQLLKIEEKVDRAADLERQMAEPNFWADQERARHLTQEYARFKDLIDRYLTAETEEQFRALELETLFGGRYDDRVAIVTIHAGAGGTEAQDWTQMLFRMYDRFATAKQWKLDLLEQSPGEEAGYKSVSFRIIAPLAYGWLKGEGGVHRLVRISPYDSDKARHTSFALVEVVPEIAETGEIELDERELDFNFSRSGGAGGQNVNKVETAVRVTHVPTGLVAYSQVERSQLKNRELALKLLRSKLAAKMEEERAKELRELKGDYKSAEWGSQIRSYVLQPYQLVKDHRTGVEVGNADSVLNGELQAFLEGYLRWKAEEEGTGT